MSIADQITRLQNAKAAIKTAITNKGVVVSDTAKLDEYPALINSINVSSGSGGSSGGDSGSSGSEYEHPDFFSIRTTNGTDYSYLFYYAREHQAPANINNWDISKVTNLSYTFAYSNITFLDLSNWDTSNVKNMTRTFASCYVPSLDLSKWNTNNVENMDAMFYSYSRLTSLNVSGWNTSKVKDMNNIFYNCSGLTSLDLSGWNTSKVTSATAMFYNCSKLVDIYGELDFSNLTGGIFIASYSNPFYKCNALETVYMKNIYKDITIKNDAKYGINLGETKVKDECLLYIINELPDLVNDKGLTATD